ncbi:MAG: hypothetical protein KIS94_16235 [Chitinophagales bacterium]|nr:hypothetical protein [Chitinophagales bacterium]
MNAYIKTLLFSVVCTLWSANSYSQQQLPAKTFYTLRDSVTSMDIILMQGKGGSLSLEGRNVQLFNSFFENKPAAKSGAPQAGMIMWLINGREFISGNFYLGDSTGYVVFQKDGKEYVNRMNNAGNTFFFNQINK